ncbi:NlpC/P60 family protein [Caballeronia sp. DA-9]|uniref:C40 family peptidase n=1 Tax=Caballeronia sp. DA-9 TaxID=3436237 RepID=UPI003F68209D
MRRFWSLLLLTFLVAACSSAPQRTSRAPGESTASAANRTFAKPSGFPNFVDHSVGQEEISIQAMSLVGVPYRWGGNTPEAGFDCSGLVRYVVDRAASVNLPRTTADMSSRGESIEPDEVAPGDLIFFNTTGRAHSHVGIYVGKLRFVNAPSTGGTVRLDYLTNPYWAKRFDGIRRVAPPKAAPTPFDSPTYLASPVPVPADSGSGRSSQMQVATISGRTAPGADAFEPPPPALSAAQRQAQSAGAVSPAMASVSPGADPFEPPPPALSAAQRQSQSANASSPARAPQTESSAIAAASNSPDPIAAAADAFEPPPPTARLAAQQVRAVQEQQPSSVSRIPASDPAVHVMRASTNPLTPTRPAPAEDPIAKFANGSY